MMTKKFSCTVLKITDTDGTDQYSFEAYRLPCGAIWIPGDVSSDWFFECEDDYQPCGTDTNIKIEKESERDFYITRLTSALRGSISEYGFESVPQNVIKYCLSLLQ